MALDANTAVLSPLKKYSIQVYRYDAGTIEAGVTPPVASGDLISADLSSVTITSDASPGSCVFSIPNDSTTMYINPGSLTLPVLGDEIYVRATAIDSDDFQSIFKGYVVNVSSTSGDEGSVHNIECVDMKARLNDDVITKTYNEQFNNTHKPNFSATDTLLHEEKWNISEILEDIVNIAASGQIFSFTASPVCYFTWNDFDFSEVSELLTFVPDTLVFNNTPIMEAIYKTITAAGSYRLVYNPDTDKLIITRVSLGASEAGDIRRLYYATASTSDPNKDYTYDAVTDSTGDVTGTVNVIQDNIVFRLGDIATVIRVTGGDIKWWSGHYRIDEQQSDYDFTTSASGAMYLTNRSWDGFKYEFPRNSLTGESSGCYILVGCPLYPQWNPATGYDPYKIKIKAGEWVTLSKGETLPSGLLSKIDDTYVGLTENDGQTIADVGFVRETGFEPSQKREMSTLSGYVYEAWLPWPGKCLYCDGTGAVVSASGWDASWFGDSRNDDGSMKRGALTAWNYNLDSNGNPTTFPVPWDNTCPACRGVGMEPKFKINNILSEVIDLPPSKIAVEQSASGVVVPGNRTWSQQVSDLAYSYPVQVQLETVISDSKCVQMANMPYHSLADATSLTGNVTNIFTGNDRKVKRIFKTNINVNPDCSVDYVRGNVIFREKVGITCIRMAKHIRVQQDGGTKEEYFVRYADGTPAYYGDGVKETPLPMHCYWRAPRAWISCYFLRDRFYDTRPDIHDSPSDYFNGSGTYRVRFGIMDNKPVYEIYEKNPDPAIEFDSRPVIVGIEMPNYVWQISPYDYCQCAMPGTTDNTVSAASGLLLSVYNEHTYQFPYGMVSVWEPIRASELASTNLSESDVGKLGTYPKLIQWVQQDERHYMLQKAIKELEKRNDVQISGSVTLRGNLYSLANGLGYAVTNYNGTERKACVVKMVHSFKGAFTTNLELSTEEFRIGEKEEKEKDSSRLIERRIDQMIFKHPALKPRFPTGQRVAITNMGGKETATKVWADMIVVQ